MKNSNKVTQRGTLEICEHEGIVLGPYLDSRGIWTFGVGHTAAAGGPNPAKMPRHDTRKFDAGARRAALKRAIDLFVDDLAKYERRVNEAVKVPLTPYQFDAVVSWDLNTGGATWRHPRTGKPCQLIQQLNSGDYSGAGFMGWLKPKELEKRRKAELNLFRSGKYEANGSLVPIWDALPDGGLKFSRYADEYELRKLMWPAKPEPAPWWTRWFSQ